MKRAELLFDYILLLIGGMLFILYLYFHQGQRSLSLIITGLFVLFYIVWSIHHHLRSDILRLKNVLEYVLIGLTILVFSQLLLLF